MIYAFARWGTWLWIRVVECTDQTGDGGRNLGGSAARSGLEKAKEVVGEGKVAGCVVGDVIDVDFDQAVGQGLGIVSLGFATLQTPESLGEAKAMGFDGPFGQPEATEGLEVTGLRNVAGQVIGQFSDPADRSDIDPSVILHQMLPEAEDPTMGPESAIDYRVKVGMPLLGLFVERDFDGVDPADDVLLPFGSPTHRCEAATQELDLFGQGPIAGADGEG